MLRETQKGIKQFTDEAGIQNVLKWKRNDYKAFQCKWNGHNNTEKGIIIKI